MSDVLVIPYTDITFPPSEVFPSGAKRDYPLLPVALAYQGKPAPFAFLALIDSGADHCVFPAIFGRRAGIPVESGPKMPTIGVAGAAWAYFHQVTVLLAIQGTPHNFDCRAGFMPDLDLAGVGLLGRHGFFDLFEKVAFNNTARIVELTVR